MNKKILIASLFATLMLLVPMTSVVGVSDVEDDCGCEVVDRYDLFRAKLLLVRIKVITNILLLRFRHIPEVAEKCHDILAVINSNRPLDYPIICAMLDIIYFSMEFISGIFYELALFFQDIPILYNLFWTSHEFIINMLQTWLFPIMFKFDCEIP